MRFVRLHPSWRIIGVRHYTALVLNDEILGEAPAAHVLHNSLVLWYSGSGTG